MRRPTNQLTAGGGGTGDAAGIVPEGTEFLGEADLLKLLSDLVLHLPACATSIHRSEHGLVSGVGWERGGRVIEASLFVYCVKVAIQSSPVPCSHRIWATRHERSSLPPPILSLSPPPSSSSSCSSFLPPPTSFYSVLPPSRSYRVSWLPFHASRCLALFVLGCHALPSLPRLASSASLCFDFPSWAGSARGSALPLMPPAFSPPQRETRWHPGLARRRPYRAR